MIITGIQVAEGEMAPWWYGFSYYSSCADFNVCYPIPINLVVRWAREFWWMLHKSKADVISTAYQRGKRHGKRLVNKDQQDAAKAILRMARRENVL